MASYVTNLAHEQKEESKTAISKQDLVQKYLAVPYFFHKLAELVVQTIEKVQQQQQINTGKLKHRTSEYDVVVVVVTT